MAEPAGAATIYSLARDTLQVRGPDRKAWLDGLLTCGVDAVKPGVAAYGLLLTKQGKIVSDVFLADSGQELFLGVAKGLGADVQALLDRYLVMEDAELFVPNSALFWELSPRSPLEPTSELASGSLSLGALELCLRVASVAAEGSAPPSELSTLLAWHGLGTFGVDFGERDNPHEAALDRVAVSWTKGCYLGQEVVCMQDMRGKVKRRLALLEAAPELGTTSVPPGGEGPEVLGADGRSEGRVTSVHQREGRVRLLASLSGAAFESGAELSVSGQPVRVVGAAASKVG